VRAGRGRGPARARRVPVLKQRRQFAKGIRVEDAPAALRTTQRAPEAQIIRSQFKQGLDVIEDQRARQTREEPARRRVPDEPRQQTAFEMIAQAAAAFFFF
jgi:hypothetical protein